MSYPVRSQVTRNGAVVEASGWTIERSADQFAGRWSIDLADPITTTKSDLFTITRSYGVSGGTERLVTNAVQEGMNASVASDITKSVSGLTRTTADPKAAAGQDLYFVSTAWLDKVAPGGWYDRNGVLYYVGGGNPKAGAGQFEMPRIWHPLLPQPNQQIGTFECITTCPSHRRVCAHLAQLMGCELVSNVPDLQIQRVLHVPSSQSMFQAINSLLGLWNCTLLISDHPSGSGTPRLYALDTAGDAQTLGAPKKLKLSAPAIAGVSWSSQRPQQADIIDHVIVLGAKSINTNIESQDSGSDEATTTIEELDLQENFVWPCSMPFAGPARRKRLGDYKKGFNSASAEDQKRPSRSMREEGYHIPSNSKQRYLLRETTISYSDTGEELHKTETRHTYGKNYKVIKTTEQTWQKVKIPGQKQTQMRNVKNKLIDQSVVHKATKTALAKEVVEELVLVSWLYDAPSDQYYAAAPQRLVDCQNQVSSNKNTVQKILEMNTSYRTVVVNRATEGLMTQVTTVWDVLQETGKVNSQIVNDPHEDDPKQAKKEDQFRKEFKNGAGPYHAAKTIEHPDIADDATAQAIASRVFARAGQEKTELTVTMAAPLPATMLACVCNLPSIDVIVSSDRGVRTRTLAGGDYIVIGTREAMRVTDGGLDHTIELKLRSVL